MALLDIERVLVYERRKTLFFKGYTIREIAKMTTSDWDNTRKALIKLDDAGIVRKRLIGCKLITYQLRDDYYRETYGSKREIETNTGVITETEAN